MLTELLYLLGAVVVGMILYSACGVITLVIIFLLNKHDDRPINGPIIVAFWPMIIPIQLALTGVMLYTWVREKFNGHK